MTLYKSMLMLHAGFGALALLTFWTAGLSKKGSPVHRAAGKIYLLAMVALLLPALPLAIRVAQSGSPLGGIFLLYLWVIVVTSVWQSWRAIRDKRDWARYTGPVFRGLAMLSVASGLFILGVGIFAAKNSQAIFIGFSAVGLLNGLSMLRFARRPPTQPRWWLKEHLGAMIGNGVATHIAFLAIGLPKLLPSVAGPVLQNIAWLGPLAIAVLARLWLGRRYFPKPAAPRRESALTATGDATASA